ncbi:MAG: hypothetical protein ACK55I_49615, partial [bacterium]
LDHRVRHGSGVEVGDLVLAQGLRDAQVLELGHLLRVLVADDARHRVRVLHVAVRRNALEVVRQRAANAANHLALHARILTLSLATAGTLVPGADELVGLRQHFLGLRQGHLGVGRIALGATSLKSQCPSTFNM